jgi:D-alanyl-D-alanine carboxypeptidase
MVRAGARIPHGWRWGALCLAVVLATAVVAGNADARSRRHHPSRHHHHVARESYEPSYASIVVDANTGTVMQATNADTSRHPASLTKIMTLYLLFERLEEGKIKMTTELPVSAHAAAQAPSKLGLQPGDTISVENAIRAIVTKSANDVAVVVAEAIGGSELEFAKMMTAKARQLGMMHTNYHNASGLPDDKQITTAHDIAILGRAIEDRFPEYYHFFSTRYFTYHGHRMRNHNHLLGEIPGVDGIKTGYIHDSGFNIVISVRRNHRHIVAVVFGGHTAKARDARMRSLIDNNINIASAKRTAPPVVEGWAVAKDAVPAKEKIATATPLPPAPQPASGSTAPIRPNPVETFVVEPGPVRTISVASLPSASRSMTPMPVSAKAAAITTMPTVRRDPPASLPSTSTLAEPHGENIDKKTEVAVATPAPPPNPAPSPAPKARGGWMIQVGAFDTQTEAVERLNLVKSSSVKELLSDANPFTERVEKGDKAMYRARFAGLDKRQAEHACKHLKRSDIPCLLLKN